MKKLTITNALLMAAIFIGAVLFQACKKENEVTVRAQIEGTWYAESVTTTYTDEDGDGVSGTDSDQNWSIKFDDGNYVIDGENDFLDSNGTYSINGDDMTLYPQNGDPKTWKIENVNNSDLKAKYTDSDDDGEFTVVIDFNK